MVDWEEASRLRMGGMKYKDIAERFGVTKSRIRSGLADRGLLLGTESLRDKTARSRERHLERVQECLDRGIRIGPLR